jgi:hypothetical protein
MQLDPAPRLSKPFLHELGMMIGRVVEKDICGRPSLASTFFGTNDLVGCGHMSGLGLCGAYVRGP